MTHSSFFRKGKYGEDFISVSWKHYGQWTITGEFANPQGMTETVNVHFTDATVIDAMDASDPNEVKEAENALYWRAQQQWLNDFDLYREEPQN